MVTFIYLYPIVALCLMTAMFDLARRLRRKGNKAWLLFAAIFAVTLTSLILWVVYRGDLNAENWAKEWSSLLLVKYFKVV